MCFRGRHESDEPTMKNEILARVLAMSADERDGTVASAVLKEPVWNLAYDSGLPDKPGIMRDGKLHSFAPSTSADDDYFVLAHCREKWSYSDKTMFNHKIIAINHTRDEWPWLPSMVYHIGDYSIAALATVLEVEEASGQRMDGLEKPE